MDILLEPPRTAWDLKWSMLRIPVRVHPLFWLMALFLSYFDNIPFSFLAIGMAAIFISVLVHEFGHALSGIYYGNRNPSVVLYQMGGLCVGGSKDLRRWQRISMLLWGPGAGFVLGAVAFGLKWAIEKRYFGGGSLLYFAVLDVFWINLTWGILNLMPVFPLDGGQIVREIVRWKAPAKGDRLAFTISFYAAIALAVLALGFHLYMESKDPRGFMPVLIFGWLAYQSWTLRKQIELYGDFGGGDEGPRQPWEQDADWWKR